MKKKNIKPGMIVRQLSSQFAEIIEVIDNNKIKVKILIEPEEGLIEIWDLDGDDFGEDDENDGIKIYKEI